MKIAVSAAVCACVGLLLSVERAQATGTTGVCAALDSSQGGTPLNLVGGLHQLTVVAGDRIRAVNTAGSVAYTPPGGVLSAAASPAIFHVGQGQAGVWNFSGSATTTVSCTVDGAFPTATDKSNIADHLLNAFNQVDTSIFGPDGVPGLMIDGGGFGSSFSPVGFADGSDANTANPLAGVSGFAAGPAGVSALPGGSSDNGFSFEADLRSLLARAQETEASGLGYGGPGTMQAAPSSPWNTWIAGRYIDFNDDQADADRDGHLWWITSGLSRQLSDRTTVGAFARVRQGEVTSTALDADLDSRFFGGGAFASTRTGDGIRLLAGALYESGDHDIAIGDVRLGGAAATGSFDTDQWTLEARLDKRFASGPYWIEPSATVRYTDIERGAYTDSAGKSVAGSDLSLGRVSFGPTVGTTIDRSGSTVKPFARINGFWDFEHAGDFTLSTGEVISSADSALNLGGGVEVAFDSGMTLVVAGDWFSFDTALEGWSLTGGLGVPLSAFGFGDLGPGGLVSLGFAGREDDASANAKVTMPLN